MAIAETAELVAELNVKGNFAQAFAKAQRGIRSLDKETKGLRTQVGKATDALGKNLKAIAGSAVKVGAVLSGVGVVAFKMAADYEEQLRTINTVAKVSDKELGDIGESLRQTAATTGTALGDLTSAYYDLVSAGVKAADAQGILNEANKLAIGGLSSTAESVDLLTTAINVYGFEAKDARRITDGFAQSIADGKVTAAELAASFADVAPFAKDLGVEIEELQAGYALLTARGIKASQASTYMKSAIAALINPTADLQKLQAKLNVDFADLARDRGLVYAYDRLRDAAEDAGIPLQKLTGRIEGAAFATNTGGRNFRAYNEQLRRIRESSAGAGTAAAQMAERQKGVNASLRRLRETARDVAITFGEGILPGAVKGFDALGKAIRARRQQIKGFGDDIGNIVKDFFTATYKQGEDQGSVAREASPFERLMQGAGKAFDELKSLPWDTIKEGLRVTSDVAKEAIGIFRSLPPEVQAGLVTLLAANKVTGGALAGLGKAALDLALKAVTVINAGNVTVVGQSVTGPGGGTDVPGTRPNRPKMPGGVTVPLVGAAIGVDLPALIENTKRASERALAELRAGKIAREAEKEANKPAPLPPGVFNARLREQLHENRLARRAAEANRTTSRAQLAQGRLAANAALRMVPGIAGVRSAVQGVQTAVRQKDLSVRVTTSVSAVTNVGQATRVTYGNRVVL